MKKTLLIPLAIFMVLVVFLAIGLTRDPREIPSPLIGKPAPVFTAPVLDGAGKVFSSKDMLGQVWLLNTWASWCVAWPEWWASWELAPAPCTWARCRPTPSGFCSG